MPRTSVYSSPWKLVFILYFIYRSIFQALTIFTCDHYKNCGGILDVFVQRLQNSRFISRFTCLAQLRHGPGGRQPRAPGGCGGGKHKPGPPVRRGESDCSPHVRDHCSLAPVCVCCRPCPLCPSLFPGKYASLLCFSKALLSFQVLTESLCASRCSHCSPLLCSRVSLGNAQQTPSMGQPQFQVLERAGYIKAVFTVSREEHYLNSQRNNFR